jgi:hypothetical protein
MFNKEALTWKGILISEIDLEKMNDEERMEMFAEVYGNGDHDEDDQLLYFELVARWQMEQAPGNELIQDTGARSGSDNPLEVFWSPISDPSVFPERFMLLDFGSLIDELREAVEEDSRLDLDDLDESMRRAVLMRDALKAKLDGLSAAIEAAERKGAVRPG